MVLKNIYLFIYLAAPDLRCSMCDLVSRPGIEPGPADLEAWSLSHWTARKVTSLTVLREHQLLCGDWMRIQARVENGSFQKFQGVPSRARFFHSQLHLHCHPVQLVLLTFLFYTVNLVYTLCSKIIFKKVKF